MLLRFKELQKRAEKFNMVLERERNYSEETAYSLYNNTSYTEDRFKTLQDVYDFLILHEIDWRLNQMM